MHLLIDGYNLIHACGDLMLAHDKGAGKEALASALNLYRKTRSHRITLVFDAGESYDQTKTSLKGIPVIFSGANQSADDVIAKMCSRKGPGLTVITDDRELSQRCARHGSSVIGCNQFARRLLEAAMDIMPSSFEEEDNGWDFTTKKKGPSRREPKAKRRKTKKLRQI